MGGVRYVLACSVLMMIFALLPRAVEAMSYIAMGDSFTSGEGETSDIFYQAGTNETLEKCHVSLRSYPYLLQQEVGVTIDTHSVACSGAETIDIAGPGIYKGQGNRLTENGLGLDAQGVLARQLWALQNYIPGETQQANFIGHYHPDIISLGIGGNDIGMIEKLKSCMMPDTCEWANGDRRRQAGREIRNLFSKLVVTYDAVRTSDPSGVLYAIGYPKVIDGSGLCDVLTGTLFNYSERQFMNQAIEYLDAVIEGAAEAAGAVYVQESNAFSGQSLCDPTVTPAMNGIRSGDDIAPVGSAAWLALVGNETFHPTPYGHVLLSSTLRQVVLARLGQPSPLPQENTLPPDEPSYWEDDGRALPLLSNTKLLKAHDDADSQLDFSLPAGSFKQGSSAQVTVHSEPVLLATMLVDEDGGVSGKVTLPNSLENGFHTIIVEGNDQDGNLIDYYEVMKYTGGRSLEAAFAAATVSESEPHQLSGEPPSSPGALRLLPISPANSMLTEGNVTQNQAAVLGARAQHQTVASSASGVPRGAILLGCGIGLLGCGLLIVVCYRHHRRGT